MCDRYHGGSSPIASSRAKAAGKKYMSANRFEAHISNVIHFQTCSCATHLHPGAPAWPSQSLVQMNVLHLHSVLLSFFPLGPRGRLHIQKERPQLTPGFFVSIVLQGSLCSHLGAIGLENNLPQVRFDAKFAASSSTGTSVSAGGFGLTEFKLPSGK